MYANKFFFYLKTTAWDFPTWTVWWDSRLQISPSLTTPAWPWPFALQLQITTVTSMEPVTTWIVPTWALLTPITAVYWHPSTLMVYESIIHFLISARFHIVSLNHMKVFKLRVHFPPTARLSQVLVLSASWSLDTTTSSWPTQPLRLCNSDSLLITTWNRQINSLTVNTEINHFLNCSVDFLIFC